jgi:hypothetical protein
MGVEKKWGHRDNIVDLSAMEGSSDEMDDPD